MNIENPLALLLLLPLIPAVILTTLRLNTLSRNFAVGARRRIAVACRFTAAVFVILALAKISWGVRPLLLSRSGQAVSFVFDISVSMTVEDIKPSGANGASLSRLEASRLYAQNLLTRFDSGTPVSVVIAKGDGVVAVPLTNDTTQVTSFFNALSPALMTSPGSNIGQGITAASFTFPADFAYKPVIIVFTDGDETDNSLQSSAADALRAGISVFFVGFGSTQDTEILAGDGVTRVKTSLKKDHLITISDAVTASILSKNYQELPFAEARFFDAAARGSAAELLESLRKNAQSTMTAEIQPVPRYAVFLLLAIIFFIAGLLFEQLNFKKLPASFARFSVVLLVALFSFMNISCAASLQGAAQILSGVYQWNRKNYVKAESLFISAAEHAQNSGEQDKTLSYYALYGLAVTYLAQGNAAQAADCFAAITEEAPVALRFASFYNAGILASSVGEYEKAADFFKRALTVDSNNVDAKINLEISRSLQTAASRGAEQELIPASTPKEDPSVTEQAIFSVLREMDTNQWKNSQTEQDSNAAVVDY